MAKHWDSFLEPLYCLALVPFWMYLAVTLPTYLVFHLTWNYKVPVSCIYSAVWISKLSGSSSVQLSLILTLTLALELLLLLLTSLCSYPQTLLPNSEPPSEITRLWQKVGTVHELKPMSRNPLSHFTSVKFCMNSKLQIPNSKLQTSSHPVAVLVLRNSIFELKTFWLIHATPQYKQFQTCRIFCTQTH